MNTILEVENLTKKFKDLTAVDNLSFSVEEGDIYGFLGQNGAGKSTTIRMLLTLIRPTGGSIKFFNKDLFTHREEILRRTGAIIERPDFYNYLTAYENVLYLARLSGEDIKKEDALHYLNLTGLLERAHSKVKTFSQGMKQRLGITVALVHNPAIIVLDEPTNGLDPQGIAETRHFIKQLSVEHGKTIIVSSHLLNEIELIANKLLIIHKGKKIIEGTTKQLLDPAKTLVEFQTNNDAAAKEILLHSTWSNYLHFPGEEKIILQVHKSLIPEVVAFMVSNHVEINAVNPRHSLEDYFLSLTNPVNHVASPAI